MLAFQIPLPVNHNVNSVSNSQTCERRHGVTPSMGPWKKGEKDEAFKQQQEILARRRDARRNKDYFNDVAKRREDVEEYFDNRTLKVNQGEDPLVPWKKMKENGYIDDAGYTEEDEGGIPIPMASFGIPKYDRGGRFDLKLPHVEVGYTDPDADIMAKAGRAFKNLFGFAGKEEETKDKDIEQKEN